MNTIYILLITFASIILSNLIYTLYQKILNNKIDNKLKPHLKKNIEHIVTATISMLFLIYFIVVRFYDDWVNLHNYIKNPIDLSEYSRSIVYSKALLLDFCPFLGILLPLSLIFDKTKRFSACVGTFSIYGGMVTLPFIFFSEPDQTITAHYLFIGTSVNPLYFLLHWYLAVYGIIAVRRYKIPKFKDLIILHIIALVFYSYVLILSNSLNVTYNVSGTNKNDWMDPIYGSYYGVHKFSKIDYPYVVIVSFIVSYIVIVSFWCSNVLIRGWIKKRKIK